MRNLLAAFCILGLAGGMGVMAAESSAPPIVRIICTYQKDNPYYPWQRLKPGVRAGFGVVIDSQHVLTTENIVRNNTLIQIRRPHSGKRITATLVKSDCQVDLALLHIEDANALKGISIPGVEEKLPLNSKVKITQIDETAGIQTGDGSVVKAFVSSLPSAPYSILQYDILTDLNVTGEGAPVFHGDKLAGIMMSYRSGSRTGKMIPGVFITRFIEDVLDGHYDGFAFAGFSWETLVDPVKRKYLGVDSTDAGVRISSCVPSACRSETLRPNDVLLEWDGHRIDNLGYYHDETYGRLLFPHLVKSLRKPGEEATAKIVRNGKPMQVKIMLMRAYQANDLIPENTIGAPVPYIITGGIVIQEVTGRLLKAFGQSWQTRVDPLLAHIYLTRQDSPETPGDHIVLFTRTLNDPINISYQQLSNEIIEKINGKPIHNIRDVFRIMESDGGIKSISLHGIGVDIVLDQTKIQEADQRIAQQYRLPALQRRPVDK
jgi:S1-C subfamily serine protease